VPSWGRPPGAKGSKRRRQWEREQATWQQEQSRVEELDSDDTDTQGVGLNFEKKRFSSDPLQFTGIDLTSRARQSYAYNNTDSSSDSDSVLEYDGTNALQIALREKEEALVQSALARIRRAQEKGKREVKLNQDELDALEKRRKRMQAAATTRERKGSGSGSERERKRRSERQLISIPIPPAEPKSRKKGKSKREVTPPSGVVPAGMLIAGADGPSYAPLGYYPQAVSRSSPGNRRSSTSQQLRGAPPQYGYSPSSRHLSEGARPTSSSSTSSRRPLPDEEDWQPSRRGSTASSLHDPFEYQVDSGHPPPIPGQYASSGRRNVSNPAEVAYSSLRRNPPVGQHAYPSMSRGSSDPSLKRQSSRREEIESSSDDDESDDELGNGVQVYVEEKPIEKEKEKTIARKANGKRKGKR